MLVKVLNLFYVLVHGITEMNLHDTHFDIGATRGPQIRNKLDNLAGYSN